MGDPALDSSPSAAPAGPSGASEAAPAPAPGSAPTPHAVFDLTGRVAIVTGASSGLGARFARVLHAAGAHVVAAARRADRLDALAAELGERLVPAACDVTDATEVEALVALAQTVAGGRIDVLVNNAGTAVQLPAEEEPVEWFEQVVDVNLVAVFRLSQLVGRVMLAQGSGSIVNIASMYGLVGSAPIKQASYASSKGAVVNLTRELGCQWSRRGVRVNAIAPGWFPSEMTESMWGDEASERFVERTCPMGRAGHEHELDGALLFLASDASTYVTGQTVAVDGGWTAR